MYTPFADNQERFVFQRIRQINGTQLEAAQPTGYFYLLQRVEHIAKLVHSIFVICIGFYSLKAVQLLRRNIRLFC